MGVGERGARGARARIMRRDRAQSRRPFAPFDRHFFDGRENFTLIGSGEVGGKAQGLAFVRETLREGVDPAAFPGLTISIPTLTVLGTDLFDAFLEENALRDGFEAGTPDARIAHAFQRAHLPAVLLGDLRA